MAGYEGMPVTAASGKWAVDLCACCVTTPYCLLPCCATCAPCVPLARAAGRAGVLPYRRVFAVSLALVVVLMAWPSPHADVYAVPEEPVDDAQTDARNATDYERYDYVIVRDRDYWPLQLGFYLVATALFALTLVVRRRLVVKYGIDEHPCVSCALLACCSQCAIGQQAMHVDLVEVGAVQADCSCAEAHPLSDRQTNRDVEML